MALAPVVFGQTLPLNPKVKVLPKPQSIVPPECEQGLAPTTPLPPVAEAPAEVAPAAAPVAPPTSDLRTRLRRVQAAAESEDYASFKSALADARAAVSAYPGGGEKQAASEVLQVYGDIEHLWDYQQTNPTGAFFTASSDDILTRLEKYPGFQRAVADATMRASGQTIYPSRESRQFLTEEAARRLSRLGIRTPNRVVQTTPAPRRAAAAPTPKHVAPKRAESHGGQPTPAVHHKAKPPIKIAEAAPKPKRERAAPVATGTAPISTPAPAPKPTKTAPPPVPAPVPAPATETTTTTAPPPQPAPPTTTTAAVTTATTTTTIAPTTTTTESTPPATTSSAAPAKPAQQTGGGMNITFAVILIVVGVGVLIVLFRASD